MSSQVLKFGEKEVDKKEFYSSKSTILLNNIDTSKIVVSNKWKINISSKFFIGYIKEGAICPLCIILPQMSGFVKYFEDGAKNMSFMTEDKDVYLKYSKVWDKICLGLKFATSPIRNEKYILSKLEIFNGVNKTTFTDDQIPAEKVHYICIAAIDIDSVLKMGKKVICKFIWNNVNTN